MTTQIDHVVIAVNDLDQAIHDFRELGFTTFFGGDHKHRGSHNALVTFADGAYLEIIAFKHEPPVKDNTWWDQLQTYGEGFVDLAIVVDDVEVTATNLGTQGIEVNNLFIGGRKTSDGDDITWRIRRLTDVTGIPFFIDDVTDRALRVPGGERATHPNGATGIARVTIAVDDWDTTIAAYRAAFREDGPVFHVGAQEIVLTQATDGRTHITELSLTGGTSAESLSTTLAHGATITFSDQE